MPKKSALNGLCFEQHHGLRHNSLLHVTTPQPATAMMLPNFRPFVSSRNQARATTFILQCTSVLNAYKHTHIHECVQLHKEYCNVPSLHTHVHIFRYTQPSRSSHIRWTIEFHAYTFAYVHMHTVKHQQSQRLL